VNTTTPITFLRTVVAMSLLCGSTVSANAEPTRMIPVADGVAQKAAARAAQQRKLKADEEGGVAAKRRAAAEASKLKGAATAGSRSAAAALDTSDDNHVRLAQADDLGGEKKDITTSKVQLSSCKPASGKIAFNFEKATINEVLDQISRLRCMNFILSDAVKGKNDITIVSRSAVTVSQAYAAFLSALEANGMALVPAGAFWKVVERKEAAKSPLPLYEIGKDGVLQRMSSKDGRAGEFPNSDAHVTLLYDVKFANKEQVIALVRNLMTKNADLQTPGGNLLILTDSGSNILRILEVLDRLDVEGTSNTLNVITLEYADAQGISQKLNDIFGVNDKSKATTAPRVKANVADKDKSDKGEKADKPDRPNVDADENDVTDVAIEKIIVDERTNQLLVICSQRAFIRVKEVLKILDVPATDSGGGVRMWVVPLANADASKASSTLSSLTQGATAKKSGDGKNTGAKAKEAEKAAALFEGDVKVTADETTNSLVIIASSRDFRALRPVIDQLDVRRPQVFVEAAILEVALNQNRNVGLSAYGSAPVDVPIPGATGPGIVTIANEGGKGLFKSGAQVATGVALLQLLADGGRLDATSAAAGSQLIDNLANSIGLFSFNGPPITLIEGSNGQPLVSFPSVGAVVNLLQGNSNVDVLSTPHLMTTDNEKAEISVGDRVPVVQGFSAGGGGGLGFAPVNNVRYEDVKLKFNITPHVNSDDDVRMEIEQEVNDISGQVQIPNSGSQPIISNRSLKTVVVTSDQRTVVIGGLIQDKKSESESKVPFFGDIPILGWLFKNWSDTTKKTNLVLLVTPYIVRGDEDFQKIYDLKMKERQQFVDSYFSEGRQYDPYVDYDKKTGPLGNLLRAIDHEMQKVENGGKGIEGEELIGPSGGFGNRAVGGDDNGADNSPEPVAPPVVETPPAPVTTPPNTAG
jgi:general secretion pathway protein D